MNDLTEQEYIDEIKSGKIFFKNISDDRQTERICLAAVKDNGYDLEYVKNQTDEICLEAVKQNGWALEYVKNQTDEICLAAVKDEGLTLVFVENQSKEIYKEALNTNYCSFIYINADIYEYDGEEIFKIYNYIYNNKNYIYNNKENLILKYGLNKIAEILNRMDDDDLVKAVSIDLKDVFIEENLKLSEGLVNIKSKADMIASVNDADKINVIDKKSKII